MRTNDGGQHSVSLLDYWGAWSQLERVGASHVYSISQIDAFPGRTTGPMRQ